MIQKKIVVAHYESGENDINVIIDPNQKPNDGEPYVALSTRGVFLDRGRRAKYDYWDSYLVFEYPAYHKKCKRKKKYKILHIINKREAPTRVQDYWI